MKTLTIILSLIIASVALAEDPAELVKLRATYDNSLRGEFQKVGKLYHGRLVELKDNFMEAKNLDGANAVDAEIKKLREEHGKQRFAPAKKASSLDGVWIANGGGKNHTFVFNGGKMIDGTGLVATVKHEKGLVTVDWDDRGWKHQIKPSPDDPNVMTGTNTFNTKFTYTRVKW